MKIIAMLSSILLILSIVTNIYQYDDHIKIQKEHRKEILQYRGISISHKVLLTFFQHLQTNIQNGNLNYVRYLQNDKMDAIIGTCRMLNEDQKRENEYIEIDSLFINGYFNKKIDGYD